MDTAKILAFFLLAGQIHQSAGHGNGFTCYQGWVLWKRSCYKAFPFALTWPDSQNNCRTLGSDLVSISSQDEYDFLTSHLLTGHAPVWIGLRFKNGNLTWSHKVDAVTQSPPKTSGVLRHDAPRCYVVTATHSARWEVKDCDEHFLFVCQTKSVAASVSATTLTPESSDIRSINDQSDVSKVKIKSGTLMTIPPSAVSVLSKTSTAFLTHHRLSGKLLSVLKHESATPHGAGMTKPVRHTILSTTPLVQTATTSHAIVLTISLRQKIPSPTSLAQVTRRPSVMGTGSSTPTPLTVPAKPGYHKISPTTPLVRVSAKSKVTRSQMSARLLNLSEPMSSKTVPTASRGSSSKDPSPSLTKTSAPADSSTSKHTFSGAANCPNLVPIFTILKQTPRVPQAISVRHTTSLKLSGVRSSESSVWYRRSKTTRKDGDIGNSITTLSSNVTTRSSKVTTRSSNVTTRSSKVTTRSSNVTTRSSNVTTRSSTITTGSSKIRIRSSKPDIRHSSQFALSTSHEITPQRCRGHKHCVSPNVWRNEASIDEIKEHVMRANRQLDSIMEDNNMLLHSTQESSLDNFFFLINFLIEGSHSRYWPQLNQSISRVVELVEPFLDTHVHKVKLHNDVMVRQFSYLDIDIQHIHHNKSKDFEFVDSRGLCNISEIHGVPANGTSPEHILLATVVMKVPPIAIGGSHSDLSNSRQAIVSPILAFSAYSDDQSLSLQPSFSFRQSELENMSDTNTTAIFLCTFWDSQNGVWSTLGCVMVARDNQTVHCRCNHTTNFAILMQVQHVKLSGDHVIALSIITYIGCSISLLTQFMAVTVFTFVGSLNSERVFIHRNLCIAIGAAQITFLAGIKAVVCAVVALVLHYCYTAMFIWMLVEGLHLYSQVVQVFRTEKSRIIYYTVFGWGVPLVLVAISAGADWEGYGTAYSCWLSTRRNTIWAFVGPALAIIFVNVVILVAVVRIVTVSAKLDRLGQYDHIRAGIKGTLFLLPLLGLTWVFGLAAVNEELVIFQYLFAIVNSLQGFFIFLFHCVLNTEVRQALKRIKQRRSLQRGDNPSSSSNSQSAFSTAWLPTKPSKQRQHKGNQVMPQWEGTSTATAAAAAWTNHRQSKETEDSELTGSSRSSPDIDEMTLFN